MCAGRRIANSILLSPTSLTRYSVLIRLAEKLLPPCKCPVGRGYSSRLVSSLTLSRITRTGKANWRRCSQTSRTFLNALLSVKASTLTIPGTTSCIQGYSSTLLMSLHWLQRFSRERDSAKYFGVSVRPFSAIKISETHLPCFTVISMLTLDGLASKYSQRSNAYVKSFPTRRRESISQTRHWSQRLRLSPLMPFFSILTLQRLVLFTPMFLSASGLFVLLVLRRGLSLWISDPPFVVDCLSFTAASGRRRYRSGHCHTRRNGNYSTLQFHASDRGNSRSSSVLDRAGVGNVSQPAHSLQTGARQHDFVLYVEAGHDATKNDIHLYTRHMGVKGGGSDICCTRRLGVIRIHSAQSIP
ncbi:hypothetical protein CYLTODRAFT_42236 [Cylindrobasidium torrendii FP15055 ss-10]|uniref:Uncharacterized protein n=1 Tax=Cylindrobasidium torrendii FP15055 ss-10 TaxID=1314674 RepID=A0A0D7B6D4_9AGAR|nr:hypothetical protein CYLTODRAFT_42236 [Cylindrobasidium torrendii FP15055 ss-10]